MSTDNGKTVSSWRKAGNESLLDYWVVAGLVSVSFGILCIHLKRVSIIPMFKNFNVSQILQYHLEKFRPKNHQLITWALYVVILSFCCYLLATTPRANNSSSGYTALLYFSTPKIDEIEDVIDKITYSLDLKHKICASIT